MRRTLRFLLITALLLYATRTAWAASQSDDAMIDALIARMTVEEKAGQLNLLSSNLTSTGPSATTDLEAGIAAGKVGAVFNVYGAAYAAHLQRIAVERSRLGIPLLLGFDVIHGFKTIFPIPLGQAASWDLKAIEAAEQVSAREAVAAGVDWTYAPMVDIARDPRWGRVAEGAGESPWLGTKIAAARVRGLQEGGLAACAKHFAAYGAAESGRDYSAADISERTLRQVYLPPFHAAIAAGVPCIMAAFNDVDGLPGVANPHLLQDILRREWGFGGLVISDYGAVGELMIHGVAASPGEAALKALTAGTDMDMQTGNYVAELPGLVRSGALPMATLDAAVRRVLRFKAQLGLLGEPLLAPDADRERQTLLAPAHLAAAEELARKSIVLLKNDGTLPFSRGIHKLAVIGPLADAPAEMLGPWSGAGEAGDVVTLLDGLRRKLGPSTELLTASGGSVERSSADDLAEAREVAAGADAVVLAFGERAGMSGEAASRTNLDLPGDQMALAEAVLMLGKPTAVVLFNGRPLTLPALDRAAPAIVEAWFPGTRGGAALADILFGDAEPVGRLPITFPRSVGQIPIYHEQKSTGRPPAANPFTSRYLDESTTPLYPFGWGLSYTTFSFAPPRLDRQAMRHGETLAVSVDVTNTGKRPGTAMAQLYVHDRIASVTRPLRELRGFQRVLLTPGETKAVKLTLTEADLAFWRADMTYGTEPGAFEVMTGPNAVETQSAEFELLP
jgi:beta-glucosidase